MGSPDKKSDVLRKGHRIEIMIIVATIILVVAAVLFIMSKSRFKADTMRIESYEGEVILEEKGRTKTIKRRMRLFDQSSLTTMENSTARINLDDSKIIDLHELSRAEISKTNKEYELTCPEGDLDFNVVTPLKEDESLLIKTVTMVVGIRGTKGHVFSRDGIEGVEITKGLVHVTRTDPVTGDIKEFDLGAGQRYVIDANGNELTNNEISEEVTGDVFPDNVADMTADVGNDADVDNDTDAGNDAGENEPYVEGDTEAAGAVENEESGIPGENETPDEYSEIATGTGVSTDMIAQMDQNLQQFFFEDYMSDGPELRPMDPDEPEGIRLVSVYNLTLKEDCPRLDFTNIIKLDLDVYPFIIWESPIMPQQYLIFVYEVSVKTKAYEEGFKYFWCGCYKDKSMLGDDEVVFDPDDYIVHEHLDLSKFYLDQDTMCIDNNKPGDSNITEYFEGYKNMGRFEACNIKSKLKRYDCNIISF